MRDELRVGSDAAVADAKGRNQPLAQAMEINFDASLQDPDVLRALHQDVVQIARWTGVDPVDVTKVLGCLETWEVAGPRCRLCGCTDHQACPGGCSWVEDPAELSDLCSSCLPQAQAEASATR